MSASQSSDTVNDVEGTDEGTQILVCLIKAAFPHRTVPEAAYRRAADTVLRAAAVPNEGRNKLRGVEKV